SKNLIDAMNSAIEEEIIQAEPRAAESDSESTLQERVEMLTKLAPRAGVAAGRLAIAITAIQDRISAIAEEASDDQGPSFTPAKDDKDIFGDEQLRDLFTSLLDETT
ncbi:hypothetical protein, partial [Sinorhizobium sp. CB7]